MNKEPIIIIAETHFGGEYPNIPVPSELVEALVSEADRENGVRRFVTLRLGEVGQVSQNGRRYIEDVAINAIEKAVKAYATGRRGHPADEDDKAQSLQWVASERVGDTLWGKAFLPYTTEGNNLMEEYRLASRFQKTVATSIVGWGEQVYNEADDIYDITALEVEYIDAVTHPGIEATRTHPKLTAESADSEDMTDYKGTQEEQNPMPEKTTEITPELQTVINERDALQEDNRTMFARLALLESESKKLAELRNHLGLGEKGDVMLRVQSLESEIQHQEELIAEYLTETIGAMVEKTVVVTKHEPYMRSTIIRQVEAQKPKTREQVQATINSVIAEKDLAEEIKRAVVRHSGGAQRTGGRAEDDIEETETTQTGADQAFIPA